MSETDTATGGVCGRCGVIGTDVRIQDCGCYLHVRCVPIERGKDLSVCPGCHKPCKNIYLIPMSFEELDEALETAAEAATTTRKREKKRKVATIARLNPEVSVSGGKTEEGSSSNQGDDLRTGRWTNDEMKFCDMLIEKFETGELPVADGVKLNDFLSNMLKSKQSRLTKKMKNAKLSTRAFRVTSGYIRNVNEAKTFSELEDAFFRSITCSMERAEVKFHLQKEWRELFSSFCVHMGQKLDCDDWLNSVEEVDRRASRAKDAAKMARRKRMMGYALEQDSLNLNRGVFIEQSKVSSHGADETMSETAEYLMAQLHKRQRSLTGIVVAKPVRMQPPPFLGRVITYMQRHTVPFEHVDAWVPSFVNSQAGAQGTAQKCRLCFAGCATAEVQVASDGRSVIPLSTEEQFDLQAFGEYSQRFSFDVGCGLPGRVYHTGIASWEQNVHNAPLGHFERCGGAVQWGIKTVLGIPIPSPNVGRIVVLLYSRHDRFQNQDLVTRIVEEMTKLMPSPKWKLVVDVGAAPPSAAESTPESQDQSSQPSSGRSSQMGRWHDDLLRLLTELMPSSDSSPLAVYLPGFTSLRMLLLKSVKSPHETELVNCIVQSFASYMSTGRNRSEIAVLVVRDFLALLQHSTSQQIIIAPSHPVHAVPAPSQNHHDHQQNQHALQQHLHHQVSAQHYPPRQIGIPQSFDLSHMASVEPTPISQLRDAGSSTTQQPQQPQQQQNITQPAVQYHPLAANNQRNGSQSQQFILFNSPSIK